MKPPYTSLPRLDQWKRDSSVLNLLVNRSQDPLLVGIDNIVEALQTPAADGEKLYLLCELFFATNFWLRNFKIQAPQMNTRLAPPPPPQTPQTNKGGQPVVQNNPQMNSGREPAVLALFTFTANSLARAFGCTTNTLPNELERRFGTNLSAHGVTKDSVGNLGSRHYLSRAAVAKFKLHFIGGKAYSFPWWKKGGEAKLELVDTSESFMEDGETKTLFEFWGRFAMSMSRDLYVGPHKNAATGQFAVVHSSWLAGLPVQCAGSIKIDNGEVSALRNDSGHYQPTDAHMVNVLQHLKALGVNIAEITVYDAKNPPNHAPSDQFLAQNGNWEKVLARTTHNVQKDLGANRMVRIRRDLEELKAGRTTLHKVVETKFEALKKELSPAPEHLLWPRAYKTVCLEFGEIDKSWTQKANSPPHPPHCRPSAGVRPRRANPQTRRPGENGGGLCRRLPGRNTRLPGTPRPPRF